MLEILDERKRIVLTITDEIKTKVLISYAYEPPRGKINNVVSEHFNRADTNQAVQSQKQARSLKFGFKKKRKCTIRVAKTKALIS